MREYQLYELFLFFALYSILGWAADRCVFSLRKRQGGRGLCKGPYMPAFGAAALLIIIGSGPTSTEMAARLGTDLDMTLPAAAVCGLGAGAAASAAAGILARICSGKWLIHVSFSDLLLWMAGGVIIVMHVQPLLMAVTRYLSPWVHMIFLTFFYLQLTDSCVDGAAGLLKYRKESTFSGETE